MSLQDGRRVDHDVVGSLVVFTSDSSLIESINGTLNQAGNHSAIGYKIEHHSSVSLANKGATAIVLDLDLFGLDINRIRRNVRRIGDGNPGCPLFLVGKKDELKASLQDSEIKQSTSRTFSKPVLGTQIITALNLINESSRSTVASSTQRTGRFGAAITALGICLLIAVSAWLWQGDESDVVLAMSSQVPSGSSTSDPALNQTKPDAVRGAQVGDIETDEALFDPEAVALLAQARSALKQGYILGPDNINALHFYRQALNIDPYNEQAAERIDKIIDELKLEFSLAIDQSKAGRSNSILKMVTELDPFNEELSAMRLRHTRAFVSPQSE